MPTLFKSLAELLEKVEATKKRLEIIGMTADFLKRLDAEEVEPENFGGKLGDSQRRSAEGNRG